MSADADEDRVVALDVDYGTGVVFDVDDTTALFLSGVPGGDVANREAGGLPSDEAVLGELEDEEYADAEFDYVVFQGVAPQHDADESFDPSTPEDYEGDLGDAAWDYEIDTELLDEVEARHVIGPDTTWFDLPNEEDGLAEAVGDDVDVARFGAGEAVSPPDSEFKINFLHPTQQAAQDSTKIRTQAPDAYEPRFSALVAEVQCSLGNFFVAGPAHMGAVSAAFDVRAEWDELDEGEEYHREIDGMFLSGMAMEGPEQQKKTLLNGTQPDVLHVSNELFTVREVAAELARQRSDSKNPGDFLGGLTYDGEVSDYDEVNAQSMVERVSFGDGIEITEETLAEEELEGDLVDHIERMDAASEESAEDEDEGEDAGDEELDPGDADEGTDEGQSAA